MLRRVYTISEQQQIQTLPPWQGEPNTATQERYAGGGELSVSDIDYCSRLRPDYTTAVRLAQRTRG